jgi:hypothetical protein
MFPTSYSTCIIACLFSHECWVHVQGTWSFVPAAAGAGAKWITGGAADSWFVSRAIGNKVHQSFLNQDFDVNLICCWHATEMSSSRAFPRQCRRLYNAAIVYRPSFVAVLSAKCCTWQVFLVVAQRSTWSINVKRSSCWHAAPPFGVVQRRRAHPFYFAQLRVSDSIYAYCTLEGFTNH